MFAAAMHRPVDEALADTPRVAQGPPFWEQPGVWVRLRVPAWLRTPLAGLALYQYLGLVLALAAGLAAARLLTVAADFGATWRLRRGGATSLSRAFVAEKLRPLTWVLALWLAYLFLQALDLPLRLAGFLLPLEKFLLAGLAALAGLRLLELGTAAYANSEQFREQRGLAGMVVPGVLRVLKVLIFLLLLAYVVYQVGGGDWLVRLMAVLGLLGLGVSLASQDTIKNYFGAAALISERPFKIGDWIVVGDTEGVVQEVAFRTTQLRTFEDELVTIPNSLLVTTAIKNKGGRAFRVFSTALPARPGHGPGPGAPASRRPPAAAADAAGLDDAQGERVRPGGGPGAGVAQGRARVPGPGRQRGRAGRRGGGSGHPRGGPVARRHHP